MQPIGIELVDAPSMDATQRGKANEQHINEVKSIVQRDPIALSATHQITP